jgi:predicted phosphodiesterase
MIYVTGDTHGKFERISHANWPTGRLLDKNDYVIVAGDFGLIFYTRETPEECWWRNWLNERPWTTLFIDGNHENHPTLNELPREEKFGGVVGKVSDSIYHLRRGEIYEIDGKKILTFGGANSIDKNQRVQGISWWPEEIPSYKDMEHCISSMEKHDYSVDLIIAHTCPQVIAPIVTARLGYELYDDPTQRMLDHIISSCRFDHYFCGHFHVDIDIGQYHFLYTKIVNVDTLIKEYDASLGLD